MSVMGNEQDNDSKLHEKLDEWYEHDEFNKMLEAILQVPEGKRDYVLNKRLASTYNNLKQYDRALEILDALKEEGQNDNKWYGLCGYAYYWKGELGKALEAFRKANEIDEEDKFASNWLSISRSEFLVAEKKAGHLKAEPLEIAYDEENEEFKVIRGTVDLGDLGIYLYHMIGIDIDKEDFSSKYIGKEMTNGEIAERVTQYYNERIENLYCHQEELNQCLLAYLFDDIMGSHYPFWEEKEGTPSFLISEKMPQVDEDNLEEAVFTEEVEEKMGQATFAYCEKPNNGTIEKPNMKQVIKECFPMIDLDKLIANIYGEYLYIELDDISFQCSSNDCDLGIACAAYAVIGEDNSFYEWHNF